MSRSQAEFDQRMMRRAIQLARRGEGHVEPNPMVGCVVVRNRRIIGEGYHRRYGGSHAEVEALRACKDSARGATVYVTLEPCCHFGKTPPCTQALIEARVARVVFSVIDPNPAVRGRGLIELSAAGIAVETGVLMNEVAKGLAPFLTFQRHGRPYVIAKWAQSLDGKLATQRRDARWISGPRSRKEVHRLRARVDAVVIGSETALVDDPLLTARGVRIRRVACRVILDGRLRISERCRLVATASEVPTLVVTDEHHKKSPKAQGLMRKGVEVAACRTRKGRLDPLGVLGLLAKRKATNVLIEGGAAILTSFLEAKVVDEAWVFVAPMLIGGRDAPSVLAERGTKRIQDALRAESVERRNLDDDVWYRLRFNTLSG